MINKKLVYWGGGLICKTCLEYYPEIKPDFIIDSNPKCKVNDLQVCSPDKIDDWKELFIVITTVYGSEIEKKLEQFGLKRGEDFLFYKDFFNINIDVMSSLNALSKYVGECPACNECVLLYIPCFTCRQKEFMTNFFKQYVVRYKDINFVVISILDVVPEKVASEKIGAKVFNLPDIVRWDGSGSKYELCNDAIDNKDSLLTDEDEQIIKKIEDRKTSFNYKKSLSITTNLYLYLKSLFEILKPSKLIIWGEWSRTSYLLAEVAKKNNIQYGFMEYGWLPGTYQFDPIGIAGQSSYATNPDCILSKENLDNSIDVEKIKAYIINKKIDTGVFSVTDADVEQLNKIIPDRKTVFLVGMGDVEMGMNPDCDYWTQYVSPVVRNTVDAFQKLKSVCKKMNWNLIFKPHPHARTKQEDEVFRQDKDVVYITDMSIDSLLEKSDVVVSICSVVDYKALVYEKPLVSLGRTTLHGQGICYEVSNKEDVMPKIQKAMTLGMTDNQKKNFNIHLHRLLDNWLWDDLSHPDLHYGQTLDKDFFYAK